MQLIGQAQAMKDLMLSAHKHHPVAEGQTGDILIKESLSYRILFVKAVLNLRKKMSD